MTDTSDDGDYLVRVRAQVMTRDDSTGGWLPLSGGGLAIVSVRRRPVAINVLNGSENNTSEKIQNTNNGPTSTAPTITPTHMPKKRHEYLIHGKRITDQSVVLSCTIKRDFEYNKVMPTFHHWRTGEKKFGLTFQTAADARAFDKGVRTAVDELLEGLVITYPVNETTDSDGGDDVFMPSTKGNDSFTGKGSITRGSDQFSPRTFCQHCRKHYLEAENRRGACAVAPDPVKRGVEIISCIPCAKGMFYHCVKGSEDDSEDEFEQSFEQIVCSCERDDKCGRRWFGLAFLSLFVPCLWLYPPLRATHWCGTSCGLWGGKHSYA
ncbi:unnamed protein product [Trichogramma brassicae]|uniref:WH1 domain-containing protein n=1 Tax=Trichogramma brassicae TaxID=86971 RepID=A0A6H5IST7_9HYME|nr:unnamed protein product [Trichogramma brassicae]